MLQQVNERQVIERLHEVNIRETAKDFKHRAANLRVEVDWKNDVRVASGPLLRNLPDGEADIPHGLAEAFAAVRGDQHEGGISGNALKSAVAPRERLAGDIDERVHHCVTGHVNAVGVSIGGEKGIAATGGRGEKGGGHRIGNNTIHFLRERLAQIARAQTRFDVSERDVAIKAGHGCGKNGRGVALRDDPIRPKLGEDLVKARQKPRGETRKGLIRLHDVEVDVGTDVEQLKNLIEHLPVLARCANGRSHLVRALLKFEDDRGHFDCLRPGAHDAEHFFQATTPFRAPYAASPFATAGRNCCHRRE